MHSNRIKAKYKGVEDEGRKMDIGIGTDDDIHARFKKFCSQTRGHAARDTKNLFDQTPSSVVQSFSCTSCQGFGTASSDSKSNLLNTSQ